MRNWQWQVGLLVGASLIAVWPWQKVFAESGPTYSAAQDSAASMPLHALIDQHFLPDTSSPTRLGSDAEFLRRVFLDLIGMPPTADEAGAFFRDDAGDKRTRLIDRLLNDVRFIRHMVDLFDVMLLERRTSQYISTDAWRDFLHRGIASEQPLNEFAAEILAADGTHSDADCRPAVLFYLARNGDPHAITRDVGRIFFGKDLQCAQCHDHPLVDDYLQRDYHGLFAFFAHCTQETQKVGGKDVAFYRERAGRDVLFESVFVGDKHATGPRAPLALTELENPLLPGENYEASDGKPFPQPKHRRLVRLAEHVASGTNRAFNENVANRLLAHMMGRGLVEPLDLFHPDNPPSHPQLLTLLGRRLAVTDFDLRAFLREIALSRTYQRYCDVPPRDELLTHFKDSPADVELQVDQLIESSEKAFEKFESASEEHADSVAELPALTEKYHEVRASMASAIGRHKEANKAVKAATSQLADAEAALEALQQAQQKVAFAAQKLAKNKQLVATTAEITKTVTTVHSETEKLTASLRKKEAARDKEAKQVESLTAKTQQSLQAVLEIKREAQVYEQSLNEARREMRREMMLLARMEGKRDAVEHALHIRQARQRVAQAQSQLADLDKQLQSMAAQHDSAQKLVTEQSGKHTKAQEQLAQSQQALQQIRQEQSRFQTRQQSIAKALTYANEVLQQQQGGDLQQSLASAVDSLQQAHSQFDNAIFAIRSRAAKVEPLLSEARKVAAEEQKLHTTAIRAAERFAQRLAQLRDQQHLLKTKITQAQEQADTAWNKIQKHLQQNGTIRPLKHLTPEQLCWSMLRVTGVYDRTRQGVLHTIGSGRPPEPRVEISETSNSSRALVALVEQRTYERLKGNVAQFVRYFAAQAGQPQREFFATADQALFAANGGAINAWARPAGENVTARMIRAETPQQAAEQLYLAILSRMPTPQETELVVHYLEAKENEEKRAAATEMVWALLTSAEFRFY